MENIKLYSPLSIQIDDTLNNYHAPPDEYSDNDSMVTLSESVYIDFKDDINMQLSKSLGESCNLAKYCHSKELAEKLHSVNIEAIEFNDQLYAVTTVYIEEGMSLFEADISDIQEYITGQFSDGFGEGFEQVPITTNDGDIYVSLWNPNYWELSTNPPPIVENSIDIATSNKPDAPMIGADGNIFTQMAIAKRALIDNGQDYIVNEMVTRVMESESYGAALRVICQYVNPVDKKEYDRTSNRKTKPKER